MPDISKINALAIGSVAKVDGLAKASILDIDGVAVPSAIAAPALAYSVRLLSSTLGVSYSGVAMRIRRDSDDVEADVGFDSLNNQVSLTSPISNTSDSLSYTDLADFVDHTGTPTSAFVDEWKDQSGNARHASQATHTSQPKLYDSSTGLVEQGATTSRTALRFAADKLVATGVGVSDLNNSSNSCCSYIYTDNQASTFKIAFGHSAISGGTTEYAYWTGRGDTDLNWEIRVSNILKVSRPTGYQNAQHLAWMNTSQTNNRQEFYMDGSELGSKTSGGMQPTTTGNWLIGSSGYDFPFTGYIQELIIWPADYQDLRTTVATDLNNFFDVY